MSSAARTWLRFRWFVYDAASRPVVVVAVLAMLGVVAAIAAALTDAASTGFGGFTVWISTAVDGFRPDVQLGLLVASILLVIDALSGAEFPRQRVLFGVIALLAGLGVAANVTAMVTFLTETEPGIGPAGASATAEAWTVIIANFLTPTVLAAVSGWLALMAMRLLIRPGNGPT